MSRFIESISIEVGGTSSLLSYHQARVDRAIGQRGNIDLQSVIAAQNIDSINVQQKLRIVYDVSGVIEITIQLYTVRLIKSLQLVDITFDYDHKYEDRSTINQAYSQKGKADDVLMVRDGQITDTSYANVALYNQGDWVTPDSPLLPGCRRQSLIDDGTIVTKKIRTEALDSYPYLMLFNAMIPFGQVIIPTSRILRST